MRSGWDDAFGATGIASRQTVDCASGSPALLAYDADNPAFTLVDHPAIVNSLAYVVPVPRESVLRPLWRTAAVETPFHRSRECSSALS